MKKIASMFLAAALFSWTASEAQAYPLNPWGSKTATGAVAINPFLYVYGGPTLYPYFYGAYGINDKMDVWAGVGAALDGSGGGFGGLEIFPRYFVNENLGLVAHFFIGTDSIIPSPEVHYVQSWDKFALTVNAGWRPVVGYNGSFAPGTVNVILAPEYNISSQLSVFLEVDPVIGLDGSGVALTLVPGIGFALDPEQTNTFAAGFQVAVAPGEFDPATALSFGIWYSRVFGGE
ncbi:MAG: hypothetical protein ACKO6N_11755 [Myxococcota bacterium]